MNSRLNPSGSAWQPSKCITVVLSGGRVELGKTILETAQMELEEGPALYEIALCDVDAVGCIDVIVQDDCVESSDDGEKSVHGCRFSNRAAAFEV